MRKLKLVNVLAAFIFLLATQISLVGCNESIEGSDEKSTDIQKLASAVSVESAQSAGQVTSPVLNNFFGSSITDVGDYNNDGVVDFAVGAPVENEHSGAVYIYSGSDLSLLEVIDGSPRTATNSSFGTVVEYVDGLIAITGEFNTYLYTKNVLVQTLPYEWVRSFDGINFLAGRYGRNGVTISPAGLVLSTYTRLSSSGVALGDTVVFYGSDYFGSGRGYGVAFLGTDTVWADTGDAQNEAFGRVSDVIDDLDSDGVNDIIVSAPYSKDTLGNLFAGFVMAVSGSDGTPISGWKTFGQPSSQFGLKMTVSNDLNNDGVSEVLVVAPKENDGTVYVLSGVNGSVIGTKSGLSTLANVSGFSDGKFLVSNPLDGVVYVCTISDLVNTSTSTTTTNDKNKGKGKGKKK